MSLKSRYPGAIPFEKEQNGIFFGRQTEIDSLRRKIKLVPLTVLYGKSGYGKSSLINAGLLPKLEEEADLQSLRIRFNPWQPKQKGSLPLETTRASIASISQSNNLARSFGKDESLWRLNKEHFIDNRGEKGLFLIFDQFEELFTYPREAIHEFKKELAEVLFTNTPQRYWDQLEDAYDGQQQLLDDDTLQLFQQPPIVKVLLAIRSDRVHLLEKLSDFIPSILKNLVELTPLDERQARRAITEPAIIKGDFDSPRYTYQPEALNKIISFLSEEGTEDIETTQLQIICNNLENKITDTGAYEVTGADVENLDAIIENYYEERISRIKDPEQAYAAKKFIEEGLIFEEEERRLSVYEGQVFSAFKLKPETLRALVDSHLLRPETSLRGGYTYELSHDTLVKPILKAKKIRVTAEREQAQREMDEKNAQLLAEEKKKRRRAYLIAIAGIALALIASLAAIFAYQQYNSAEKARKNATDKAFDLSMQLAENFKVQGNYEEALNHLMDLQIELPDGQINRSAQIQDSVTTWESIQGLLLAADSLITEGEWALALENFREANEISNDGYLTELVRSRTEEANKRKGDLLQSAASQTRAERYDVALSIYQAVLKIDPTDQSVIDAIENLNKK